MATKTEGREQLLAAEAAVDSAVVSLREATVELSMAEMAELRQEGYDSTEMLQQLQELLVEMRTRRSRVEALSAAA